MRAVFIMIFFVVAPFFKGVTFRKEISQDWKPKFKESLGLSPVTWIREKIRVDSKSLDVELALTPEQQQRGLMFRSELPYNQGMLFVFPEEKILIFWMKNTFIPLSIGFFDKKGFLIEILDMDPVQSEIQQNIPSYSSSKPARFALEVSRGWFHQQGLKPGAQLFSTSLK
jgi:uncharacterized protein